MPGDMSTFNRILQEQFIPALREELSRPMWATAEEYAARKAQCEANRPTREEWEARQAEYTRRAEELRSRERDCLIEEVQAGDELDVRWGDQEGLNDGWYRVIAVYPTPEGTSLFGHAPVLVLISDWWCDDSRPAWAPVYDRGDKVRKRVPA